MERRSRINPRPCVNSFSTAGIKQAAGVRDAAGMRAA
jgi:hypothetical protein